jgi:hypothetical protein
MTRRQCRTVVPLRSPLPSPSPRDRIGFVRIDRLVSEARSVSGKSPSAAPLAWRTVGIEHPLNALQEMFSTNSWPPGRTSPGRAILMGMETSLGRFIHHTSQMPRASYRKASRPLNPKRSRESLYPRPSRHPIPLGCRRSQTRSSTTTITATSGIQSRPTERLRSRQVKRNNQVTATATAVTFRYRARLKHRSSKLFFRARCKVFSKPSKSCQNGSRGSKKIHLAMSCPSLHSPLLTGEANKLRTGSRPPFPDIVLYPHWELLRRDWYKYAVLIGLFALMGSLLD